MQVLRAEQLVACSRSIKP